MQRELVPHLDKWEAQGVIDREAWLKAGEAGLLCASIPVEYGGGGGTEAHDLTIYQEIVRAGLGGGFGAGYTVSYCIVAHYILAYGTEAQKREWLPRMARGEIIGAIAMTEPGAGSDLQAVRTTALKVDGGYAISGSKTYISNGQCADLVLVVAKTDPTLGAKGMSLIAVEPAKVEGFRRGRNLDKMGMHAQDTSELFFDNCIVPEENILGGTPGMGFVQLMQQLVFERMLIVLGSIVAMEQAVDMTTAFVRERPMFGQRLWDFQNTQFKLAEAKTIAIVARTFADALITRMLADDLDPATAAAAKLWATENQGKVVDECLQLFGGAGYMNEYPISRLYTEARVARIFGGSSEVMKLIVSRTL
ncbi:MAG: acyl-CoA dehydrogenase family protein [Novosphingobium sp.]|nr:acyl-CoA dehydrogenase family protein [Novosphingobium sp.]